MKIKEKMEEVYSKFKDKCRNNLRNNTKTYYMIRKDDNKLVLEIEMNSQESVKYLQENLKEMRIKSYDKINQAK